MESILEAWRADIRSNQRFSTMSRLPTPASIETSPAASQPLLQAFGQETVRRGSQPVPAGRQQPGRTGRLSRIEWRAGQGRAGGSDPRGPIALAVAEVNGCDYCLSAHLHLGKNLTKLSDAEIAANRNGHSADAKADAAVGFAVKIVNARGHVSDADIKAVKDAGYDDAQVIEIVLHVALNTLTNYVNEVAKTAIYFPAVAARAA